MAQTGTGTSASVQIAFHQRMAQLLHDHATWAALATVVVLLAKYLFNLPITQAEVLTFFGIMATYLFGASWVATAHINAMTKLGQQAMIEGSQSGSTDFLSNLVQNGAAIADRWVALERERDARAEARIAAAKAASDSSPPPAQ